MRLSVWQSAVVRVEQADVDNPDHHSNQPTMAVMAISSLTGPRSSQWSMRILMPPRDVTLVMLSSDA